MRALHLPYTQLPGPARTPASVLPEAPEAVPAEARGGWRIPAMARCWMTLAVVSLVLAGLLSLGVVLGRIPWISPFIADPLFFQRCLVVHVNLALAVWFHAFIAAITWRAFGTAAAAVNRRVFGAAVAGVVLMLGGALVPEAQPVLANYIPVIDHWLFLGGLGLFFFAVFAHASSLVVRAQTTAGGVSAEAAAALRAALAALLLAGAAWLGGQLWIPDGTGRLAYFEFSAWGAGHVLQVANVCAMLAVWLWIVRRLTGRNVLPARTAAVLFTLLVLPHALVPLFAVVPAWQHHYIHGSTQLMRWAIFPVVLIVLGWTFVRLRARTEPSTTEQSALLAAFYASAGLTLLGFLLGAMIRGSSTLIPAHYHAALGGVTVAFMAGAFLFAADAARRDGRGGLCAAFWGRARLQMFLFGGGQALFAVGFGIGGLYGLGRKEYGADQVVRGAGELAGLGLMGTGGLLAAAGGVLFLVLILREVFRWWRVHLPLPSSGINQKPIQQ